MPTPSTKCSKLSTRFYRTRRLSKGKVIIIIYRTVIIIAHRLFKVKNADEIVVLHKGKVAERGAHNELIARDGSYKKLVERQLMSADGM